MRRLSYAVLATVLILPLAGCSPATRLGSFGRQHVRAARAWLFPQDDFGAVQDFTLTEPDGRDITLGELRGKVWIASFIFTRCAGPCAQVSGSMANLQHQFKDDKEVVLVSFTVDPEHDTPAVLRDYANRYGADGRRWLFVTGQEDKVYDLIRGSFHLGVEQTRGSERVPGNEVTHSTRLAVVDQHGHIRAYFDGAEPNDLPRLRRKVAQLIDGFTADDLPALNAVLNSASAFLVVLGYVAIRRRRITVHKACMLLAVIFSALFLASYLYYHFAVRGGQPTRFTGPAGVRYMYLGVLLSHSVLAVIAAPMVVYSAYLGLSGRYPRHVRIARWTLPIWFYVSITGVLVYVMLYHLYPETAAIAKMAIE